MKVNIAFMEKFWLGEPINNGTQLCRFFYVFYQILILGKATGTAKKTLYRENDILWRYNNVDRAEEDAKAAFLVNADAVKNLAEICQNLKVKLVHFSTDYVFDGKASKPYTENDVAVALSKYGQSKLEGEKKRFALL